MAALVVLFAVLAAMFGMLALVSPRAFARFVRMWQTQAALNVMGAVRLVFGVALVVAAPDSRGPLVLQLLGGLLIVAGLVIPFVGPHNARRYVDWWFSQGGLIIRTWGVLALAIAGLLVAAVRP